MQQQFDGEWGSDSRLNAFFFDYEKSVLTNYLLSLQNKEDEEEKQNKQMKSKDQKTIIDSEKASHSAQNFMLFENKNKAHLKQELTDLPNKMENPYVILRRFINWEMMDLTAMIDTIESKGEMESRKNKLAVTRTKN